MLIKDFSGVETITSYFEVWYKLLSADTTFLKEFRVKKKSRKAKIICPQLRSP